MPSCHVVGLALLCVFVEPTCSMKELRGLLCCPQSNLRLLLHALARLSERVSKVH